MPSNSSTGIKGVSYVKSSKKYKVALTVDGKTYYGGVFDTLEEAAAYKKHLESKYIKQK